METEKTAIATGEGYDVMCGGMKVGETISLEYLEPEYREAIQ